MTRPGESVWALALMQEANDAAALFGQGLAAVGRMRSDYEDAVAVMALLALGAEKMLKLTIGLNRVEQSGTWPPKVEMIGLGHRIKEAERRARSALNTEPGTSVGWMGDLKSQVDADPVLPQVLEALHRFGDRGRFYFLDYLGEAPQPGPAPSILWQQMTTAIARRDGELLAAIAGGATAAQGRAQVNAIIGGSLRRWWELYVTAWRTGVIGEQAKQFAPEIKLRGLGGV